MTLLTEAEAKEKWCPLVRQLGTLKQPALPGYIDYVVAAGSQNRGYAMGGPLDNCRCIASACMAWRFAGWVNLTADGSLELADDRHGPFLMPHGPTKNEHGCAHVGHCGAFGVPA